MEMISLYLHLGVDYLKKIESFVSHIKKKTENKRLYKRMSIFIYIMWCKTILINLESILVKSESNQKNSKN